MSFLTLDNVAHYHFDRRSYTKILDNITFTVKEGEFVTVLGPSGSGKTTLLSLIGGNIKPTDGNIQFRDDKGEKHHVAVGWVLEDDYLLPWKTVIDNIVVKRKSMKMDVARDLLIKTGLSCYCYDSPPLLPPRIRQSVAFLRALVSDPDIILLDEPFSKLDYQAKLKLQEMVCHLIKMHRKTALLATHDIDEAIALSDRILIMDSANASIAKTFEVPLELRQELPVFARQHPKYQLLFDKVWQELNKVVNLQHDL